MFLAQFAYFKVLCVSSKESLLGDIFAIMTVQQFPPRESFKSQVSFESQYGIWFFLLCFIPSTKALMQFPKESNDLFMLAPSIIQIPRLFVFDAHSDPAKSIKDNLPIFT